MNDLALSTSDSCLICDSCHLKQCFILFSYISILAVLCFVAGVIVFSSCAV